jgi:hypothetical protein
MRRQDWGVLVFKMIGAVIAAYGVIALGTLPSFFANPFAEDEPVEPQQS